jgi:hypothetical protein
MKTGFRAFSALALASCIHAAVFTVEAQKKSRKGDVGPTNPTRLRYQQDNSNVPYGKCTD